jgi:class 3 adenylate cyclase
VTDHQHGGEPALAALPIFADVPPELYATARRREFRSNDAIITSGTEPEELVVLVRGTVGIHEGGTRIATRTPVRLLGELAFISGETRSASVIADDAVVTWELNRSAVGPLLAHPAFCRNLNQELAWKLREATTERSFRYVREERLFGAFRSHVSAEVLDDLMATGETGRPRQAEVVAMFADIRDFTPNVLAMQPDDLMSDLGSFLDLAIDIVQAHGGMIDKFIGDEVMALWGYAPGSDHAERAFAAAGALASGAPRLTLNGKPLRVGIGLEMGMVTLGVVGGEGKSSFTAVGPAVNLAARLQGLTKELKQPICLGPDLVGRLSEEIRNGLGGPFPCPIKGVEGQIDVWTHAPKE